MRIIYVSDDGKEFDNEWECRDYEEALAHRDLYRNKFFSEGGYQMPDPFAESTYSYCDTIIVPDEAAWKDLMWLGEYAGWTEYNNWITGPGTWVWVTCGGGGHFIQTDKPDEA